MARAPRAGYRPLKSPNHLFALGIVTFISVILCWLAIGDKFDLMDIYLGAEGDDGKHAFATILVPPPNNISEPHKVDPYFTSARMLNYQLRHSNGTRSKKEFPFLVMVSSNIVPWKRKVLEREGATVVFAKRIFSGTEWIEPMAERWNDVMLKLRLFELIDYDKILFLDADSYLLKPLDRIFRDPSTRPIKTSIAEKEVRPDEAPLPEKYLLTTNPEILHTTHPWPPHPWPRFNAGFFLFQPSTTLFYYYTSLLALKDRFDSTYPKHNLLNYAHREWDNMPWAHLKPGWNVNLPNINDVNKGVRSVHAKLWTESDDLQLV